MIFTWILSLGIPFQPVNAITLLARPPDFDVRFHPDGALFSGDLVSIEIWVRPVNGKLPSIENISVSLVNDQPFVAQAQIAQEGRRGSDAPHGSLLWAWDTRGLYPGVYQFHFRSAPERYEWNEEVVLNDPEGLPIAERTATWESKTSACCQLFYVTGTRAERDIDWLSKLANEEAKLVEERLGADFDQPVRITFLPKVLGHGGFAGEELAISYPDRNYVGLPEPTTRMVLRHELVHKLDAQLGGEARLVMLAEGFATYISGGHFKPELLSMRATALMELGMYTPIRDLVKNFYTHQHEGAYLEAAALIEYLIQTYGQGRFDRFYRGMRPGRTDDVIPESALQDYFDTTLDQLEQDFSSYLRSLRPTQGKIEEVQTTLAMYDTVRAYQTELDPSAYYQETWMPDAAEMRKSGITSDYLRHPSQPANIALESWLIQAHRMLLEGRYSEARDVLAAIRSEIQAIDRLQEILELFEPRPVPVFGETAWQKAHELFVEAMGSLE